MPDQRKTPEEIKKLDAADRITHPMETSDGTVAYHFALGGGSAQTKALQCSLDAKLICQLYQVPLCCPICKSGLGLYIYSKAGMQALSENQQRKNRNTMLFGKSHMKRTHPALERQFDPEAQPHESNVTQVAEVVPKRFRAGPSTSSVQPTSGPPHSTPPINGVKRKLQNESAPEQVTKRSKAVLQQSQVSISKAAPGSSVRQRTSCKPTATATRPRLNTCERRKNDYYVDAEGQTYYDKGKGWHPDDEHESDDDSDCEPTE